MSSQMKRAPKLELVTIGATVAASTAIAMEGFAGGSFHLPADSGTTAITVYAQVGTVAYGIMNDDDWQPIAAKSVGAGLPYPLPPNAYNYPNIKLVASAGTATASVPVYLNS